MKSYRAFLIAFVIAILSWVLLKQQLNHERQEVLGEMARVVLAEIDITEGTLLTRDHIKPGYVPQKYLSKNTIIADDVETILGHPVIRSVPQENQLSWDDLKAHALRLSSDISKNHRAFSLQVDPTSTQGGQLRPGDYVDVLAIFDREEASCRTIVQNIKIVAVGGQRLDHEISIGFSNVTLELTPEQCQHLALARETGKIVLTLRSSEDHDLVKAPPTSISEIGQVTYQVK